MYGDHEPARPHPTQDWPRCSVCRRELRTDETRRHACHPCTDKVDTNLAALAGRDGLYAQLADHLTPGRQGGDGPRVTGSKTAPLPIRLEPLSLSARGGIVTILQSWLAAWHEHLGWTHPRWLGNLQEQCDQVIQRLRNNLDWAATNHPAFADFATEVREAADACRRQINGTRPERRIAVTCTAAGCGRTIHVTVSTPGARCPCGTQYTREDVLALPLAHRAA